MRADLPINDIYTQVETLYRNYTGRHPLSAAEGDCVYQAVADACQTVALEYGVRGFRFSEAEFQTVCTPNVGYVVLATNALNVIRHTVRIPGQRRLLTLLDEAEVMKSDPALQATGLPSVYWLMPGATSTETRMGLWPVPDQAYDLVYRATVLPDADSSKFPPVIWRLVRLKAVSMALMALGAANAKLPFDAEYERMLAQVKDGYDVDGPRFVRMNARWSEV